MTSSLRLDDASGPRSDTDVADNFAYATLLTNEGYIDAALTLAQSLRDTATKYPIVAVVLSEAVDDPLNRRRLLTLFDDVILVPPVWGLSSRNLDLIGRPDLAATLTKIRLWSLTHFHRVLYLDADTLACRNVDHLFSLPRDVDFAAVPELGFPDCFNGGVMLLTPDQGTHDALIELSRRESSFDGGDQGLLNTFFGDGTRNHPAKQFLDMTPNASSDHKLSSLSEPATTTTAAADVDADASAATATATPSSRTWFRLSTTYNMEMHKVFRMYIPAVLRYRDEISILHFIGEDKPWHFPDGHVDVSSHASPYFRFYAEMVGRWWVVRRTLPSVS